MQIRLLPLPGNFDDSEVIIFQKFQPKKTIKDTVKIQNYFFKEIERKSKSGFILFPFSLLKNIQATERGFSFFTYAKKILSYHYRMISNKTPKQKAAENESFDVTVCKK